MGKNKLIHFEENRTFPHFFQPRFEELKAGYVYKGCWSDRCFGNANPVVLELGCGKGEYSVGLARKYPERNFIGIDKKGARMWRGAKTSHEESIPNVAFLRVKLEQILFCFSPAEATEIWITFPEPVPKKRREHKRLTSPRFLNVYRTLLREGGTVHLKTDNAGLFEYTLGVLETEGCTLHFSSWDLYGSGYEGDASEIQTYYEKKFLEAGTGIKYLQFSFKHGS